MYSYDCLLIERLLDLGYYEGLDHVTDLDVVELLDSDTALHSGRNFLGVVLVPLEGCDVTGVDHDTVTDKATLGRLGDLSVTYEATGDRSYLGNLEGLLDLCGSGDLLLLDRLEHTFDTVLDIVDRIIDD